MNFSSINNNQSQLAESCFPLHDKSKGQKGRNYLSPSLCNQIFGWPVMKSFWIQLIPSMRWGCPILWQSKFTTWRKRIFLVKLLNYKCFLKKSMGWGPWDITFVMCGLIYCFYGWWLICWPVSTLKTFDVTLVICVC